MTDDQTDFLADAKHDLELEVIKRHRLFILELAAQWLFDASEAAKVGDEAKFSKCVDSAERVLDDIDRA